MNPIVRDNMLLDKRYTPYCGSGTCQKMPRTRWDGEQMRCPACGFRTEFPDDFINEYKNMHGLK